jgi:Domain of unknown function (DUF5655)
MPELPNRPDLDQLRAAADGDTSAPAEAEELIVAQYSGRPQLRSVLDAVLAALPALGPVTVQARKTLVSLSTPRRVFAVVQATTRSGVDLGLRLNLHRPGGRLLAVRDLGAATVRIPLTRPEDVDAEVAGWLRRAYAENAAPPLRPLAGQLPQFLAPDPSRHGHPLSRCGRRAASPTPVTSGASLIVRAGSTSRSPRTRQVAEPGSRPPPQPTGPLAGAAVSGACYLLGETSRG